MDAPYSGLGGVEPAIERLAQQPTRIGAAKPYSFSYWSTGVALLC